MHSHPEENGDHELGPAGGAHLPAHVEESHLNSIDIVREASNSSSKASVPSEEHSDIDRHSEIDRHSDSVDQRQGAAVEASAEISLQTLEADGDSGFTEPLIASGRDRPRSCCCFCAECCWQWWSNSCCGDPEDSESMAAGSGSANGGANSGVGGVFAQGTMCRSVALIFAWYFFSMGLSLYNKFLIGEKHGHFPAPLLMTTFHFTLQWALSSFLLNCVCTSWAPTTRLSCRDYNLRIIPTAMATALDIGLSNLSLAFISLTFYTMCKSSAPVFLLLFAFVFRLEGLSMRLLGVMIVISIGVLFTVAGETHFQMLGFLLVMGASITSGLRWVLIQVLLQKDKLGLTNPLVTLVYLTPVMASLCAVFSLLHEPWHMLHKTPFFDTIQHSLHSALIMVLGGLLAFFMILSEFLLVLETSAVTFSVAGTVKEGATILVSHLVFGDRFTRVNLFGIFIILLGVSLFNMHRHTKGHGPRDVKAVSSDPSSEDKQQLLSPQLHSSEASPRASSSTGPGHGGTGHTGSEHDTAEVIIVTATGTSQQASDMQQRILSPTGAGPSMPPSPSLRGLEMSSRSLLHSSSSGERRADRATDDHGE